MPRPSKRNAHLKRSREIKLQTEHKIDDCTSFVFSTIASGISATCSFIFMLLNNIMIPSASAFYRAQKTVCNTLYTFAKEVASKARSQMKNNTCISFDGSWSHRRNGQFCVVDFVDQTQKKIVDFCLKIKNIKGIANYRGPSNMMESAALTELLHVWKGHDDAEKVTMYCHDRDCKARKIVSSIMPNWQEKNDPNHARHTLNSLFKKFNNGSENLLYGLKGKLLKMWNTINKKYDNVEDKKRIWKNVPNHLCGNHNNCSHSPWDTKKIQEKKWKKADNEKNKKALYGFIQSTMDLISKIEKNCNTQLCECFHSIKARYASKTISWGYSWIGRISASILQFNVPGGWIFEARRRLNLPFLNLRIEKKLRMILANKQKRKEHSKLPKSLERRRSYRNIKKGRILNEAKLEGETKHK